MIDRYHNLKLWFAPMYTDTSNGILHVRFVKNNACMRFHLYSAESYKNIAELKITIYELDTLLQNMKMFSSSSYEKVVDTRILYQIRFTGRELYSPESITLTWKFDHTTFQFKLDDERYLHDDILDFRNTLKIALDHCEHRAN